MRLAITGGGTGGHVYPALEVGRLAREHGAELRYFGSLRGQEGKACERESVPFFALPVEPLVSIKTLAGWRARVRMLMAVPSAKALLKREGVEVLFSTGGYSAAPYLAAARSLGLPYVIFEANSVPGRTHRMFAERAKAFATVFHHTASVISRNVVRTGMPVRKALRDAAASRNPSGGVLVIGGSQGSEFLNRTVPEALGNATVNVVHATGPSNFERTQARFSALPPNYRLAPYLDAPALLEAYGQGSVVVARSGGTLAEFACFRLPSVLVPLPSAADDHQMMNAREFEAMGAATVVPESRATPEAVRAAVERWLGDAVARERARHSLADWDVPDATERIVGLLD